MNTGSQRAEVEIAKTQLLIRRLVVGVAIILIIMQSISTGYDIWAAMQTRDNTSILVKCTTPTPKGGPAHECYERGQSNQGEAVGEINLTAIYVAECALEGVRPPLTPCVESKIKQQKE